MSQYEEMSDLSQAATQSGSIAYSSFSSSIPDPINEPWGRIALHKIVKKRLGSRLIVSYEKIHVKDYELVNERTTFGRSGDCDCNISDLFDNEKLIEISGRHFTITKQNIKDALCPVFLEDQSQNGTYFRSNEWFDTKSYANLERVDEKVRRRILSEKEVIYVEKRPTICLDYQLYARNINELPVEINREYHVGKELGSGAYGTVYFIQNRRTCKPFAVKYTNSENQENAVPIILKEVAILQRLKHPCILQLYKVQTFDDSVAIVIEYMMGGDLLTRIRKNHHFTESLTKFIFYQICCGVKYLHKQNVTHRDLKPENILLLTTDTHTLVKVSDFGLSKFVNTNSFLQTQCGTRWYAAPEVRSARYTNKVDIWSLGVVLFNCFTGGYPFNDRNESDINFDDGRWDEVSENGKKIVFEMLTIDPNKRPSANELLTQRNWLSKTDQDVQRACKIIAEQQHLFS